jgi:4-amino-4-deoxy-L-arabinose transferase-like glycosyltransferase
VVRTLAIIAIVLCLRLPFLNQPVQGDDPYYLAGAEHAQIDPLHPSHAKYLFQGDLVDMRGHPHGPLDSWILAALLAVVGDVREVPFHLFYSLFSILAALAMWSLARRFSERPFWATLLFLAVPAFVVNGNSFEADLPFLALWMTAIALFVKAVDENSWLAL